MKKFQDVKEDIWDVWRTRPRSKKNEKSDIRYDFDITCDVKAIGQGKTYILAWNIFIKRDHLSDKNPPKEMEVM
jgi:hypothetical protein